MFPIQELLRIESWASASRLFSADKQICMQGTK